MEETVESLSLNTTNKKSMKKINITQYEIKEVVIPDVKIKKTVITKDDGNISIDVNYILLDENNIDRDKKEDTVLEADLDTTTKNKINNILQSVKDIIKTREGI